MKTIGIIGGMSWESTLEYYRILNRLASERYGGLHSARCIVDSVDFGPIAEQMDREEWEPIAAELTASARRLEQAGAEVLLIATNTMHLLYSRIATSVRAPVVHIADAAGSAIRADGISKIALLGTRFTMEKDFYAERLRTKFGVSTLVPDKPDRDRLNDIIFQELCIGNLNAESTSWTLELARRMIARGAEGVVLACTELPLTIGQDDLSVPVYDTMMLHCKAAVGL